MELNANFTINETLTQMAKDKVMVKVHLTGGQVFEGYIGGVGKTSVTVTKLSGREFYDALVNLDDIAAVEAKTRN